MLCNNMHLTLICSINFQITQQHLIWHLRSRFLPKFDVSAPFFSSPVGVFSVCGLYIYIYYVVFSQFFFKFAPTSSYSLFLVSYLSYILPKDTFESEPAFDLSSAISATTNSRKWKFSLVRLNLQISSIFHHKTLWWSVNSFPWEWCFNVKLSGVTESQVLTDNWRL